jgi:uncharacterized phiE125 gp8 family phage protein
MRVLVVTPPDPIVTWEEARQALRIDEDDDQQEYVEGLIAAAQAWIDGPNGWVGACLAPQTLEARLPGFTGSPIKLPYGPVGSIVDVRYMDADGVEQIVPPTSYGWTEDGLLYLSAGSSWPVTKQDPGAVRILYEAGTLSEADSTVVKQVIKLLVAHWFINREAVNVGNIVNSMPFAVDALLSTFRRWAA